jgi:transcriptional regulator with PAS, ATPase and Fis domain
VQIYDFIYFTNPIIAIFAINFEICLMNNSDFMQQLPAMTGELPFAITVCDTEGVILYMNDRSISTFHKYGGAEIIGTSLFLYHHGAAAVKLRELLDTATKNAYTIEKDNIRKMIYQSPWYKDGNFAGLIELSLEIPKEMEHFVRG